MELTHAQKLQLLHDGWVKVPGVVPRIMVDRALRAINNSMGEGIDPAQLTHFRSQSYCRELTEQPMITDLVRGTPAWSLVESALGVERAPVPGYGQIALRFPSMADPPPRSGPHVDGTYSPHNGVKEGTLASFTMLLAVLLSDLPTENCGNFQVWPGSHRIIAEHLKEHGAQTLIQGFNSLGIELPPPVQVTGCMGDIVITHYQLAHTVAANASPHIRYAIFFRISTHDHAEHRFEHVVDLWRDWPGIRAVASK